MLRNKLKLNWDDINELLVNSSRYHLRPPLNPVNHVQIRNDIISSSVSMPAIYRVSQKFVPLLYKSVMQYDWSLVRKSRRQIVKLTIVPSFDSNIRFLYFRAKGEWARVYFSATYFFAFFNSLNSPNCSNSLCFLWISWKFNPLKTKTCSHVRAFKKRVFFDLLAYQLKKLLKKLEKSECWVGKSSWRNEGFEGNKKGQDRKSS